MLSKAVIVIWIPPRRLGNPRVEDVEGVAGKNSGGAVIAYLKLTCPDKSHNLGAHFEMFGRKYDTMIYIYRSI